MMIAPYDMMRRIAWHVGRMDLLGRRVDFGCAGVLGNHR